MTDEQAEKMKADVCAKIDELVAFTRSLPTPPTNDDEELLHMAALVVASKVARFCVGVDHLTAHDAQFMRDVVDEELYRRISYGLRTLIDDGDVSAQERN